MGREFVWEVKWLGFIIGSARRHELSRKYGACSFVTVLHALSAEVSVDGQRNTVMVVHEGSLSPTLVQGDVLSADDEFAGDNQIRSSIRNAFLFTALEVRSSATCSR
jgi:hypothetical protein